jgi:hypothetical protein
VIEELTREGEVVGLNPAGRVAREFDVKNTVTCDFFWDFFVSNFVLPSARQKTLDKDGFANYFFTVWALPSVTLGKAFAECNWGFAAPVSSSARSTNELQKNERKLPITNAKS